jgi:hypothetical protein
MGIDMAKEQRDAVILLSGLHREDIGESVDLAAARFVAALESESTSVAARFSLEEARDEDYGQQADGHKARIVTVCRQELGGGEIRTKLFDVYGLDYRRTLLGDLENKRPVHHLLSTVWILAANSMRLLFSVRRHSKRSAEKWQVRAGWFCYFILFAYFLTILGAALGTLTSETVPSRPAITAAGQAPASPPDAANEPGATIARKMASFLAPVARTLQIVVVWVTAIGVFLRVDLKAWIETSGLGITAASEYLTIDRRRKSLEDQFAALLNHIGEQKDVEYRHVHVIGYSFGSIIALDALFAYDQSAAVFRRIHTLVTIGCPFDFIRTYWPTYFEKRTRLPEVPKRWINIYAPADVLGSDFTDQAPVQFRARGKSRASSERTLAGIGFGDQEAPRRPDINERYGRPETLDQYSAIEQLGFLGFTMHRQYWDGTSPGCYRNIVRTIFADEPALA